MGLAGRTESCGGAADIPGNLLDNGLGHLTILPYYNGI